MGITPAFDVSEALSWKLQLHNSKPRRILLSNSLKGDCHMVVQLFNGMENACCTKLESRKLQ